ncbi:MAG: Tetratricopeptide 2 repeat protein [Chlorobi bacterium]|nr:Tetratricopeptide 2 repeat protein [Chlorobiota bacterium]
MSLFRKLFGGGSDGPHREPIGDEARFIAEFRAAVENFIIISGFPQFQFDLLHPITLEPAPAHRALPRAFREWKEIHSPWDRRALFLHLFLESAHDAMRPWQIANILTAVRRPNDALRLLDGIPEPMPEAPDYAHHAAAFARAYIPLEQFTAALNWARPAAAAAPDDRGIRVVLADTLALNGCRAEAFTIYTELLRRNAGEDADADPIDEMFRSQFSREEGAVPSPIFAIEMGERISERSWAAEFWRKTEIEFYDSPYFRMHHAYHLGRIGEMNQSFAKLAALVEEMPWLREASLNLLRYFEHFDPAGDTLLPELQATLRRTIAERGWTTEGMTPIEIAFGTGTWRPGHGGR